MPWTIQELHALIADRNDWVVAKEGDLLSVENDEGLDAYIYAGNKQLIIETILFPQASVVDVATLNQLVLETHQLMPLTTVGIATIDNEKYYVAFGTLSSESKPGVVIEEIEMLFANTPEFLELYEQHLTVEKAS